MSDDRSDSAILRIDDLEVAYDGIVLALHGVSLRVPRGSIVALLGPNGAGKSTTLKAASALLGAERGAITGGDAIYAGRSVRDRSASELARDGLVQVLEGRHCFTRLTVEENLLSGAFARGGALSRFFGRGSAERASRQSVQADLERVYARFPRLRDKRKLAAGYTSGGEQQMIALGRALMGRPKLILLDEPSMGLAPQVVAEIFEIIATLNRDDGVSLLLAEQNAVMALRYAEYGYILENGRVASEGSAEALRARDDIQQFYLGVGAEGRTSFRPVKQANPSPDVTYRGPQIG
jgi:branched-chain amino acid transport system ATP-binding protein